LVTIHNFPKVTNFWKVLSKRNQIKFCGDKNRVRNSISQAKQNLFIPIARGANSLRSLLHSQINLATTDRQTHQSKYPTKEKKRLLSPSKEKGQKKGLRRDW